MASPFLLKNKHDMTSKIYAYIGKNFATIDVYNSRHGRIQISFTGGDMYNKLNYTPAKTKPISDPVLQELIEKSPYFGKNVILYEKYETEEQKSDNEPLTEIAEVTDFVSACEYLKENHGAKATQLKSPAGVKKLAYSIGISFPNWDQA